MSQEQAEKSALNGRLVVVRHGQTDWNKAGKMQGSSDIPLNDTGRAQAHEAGQYLADQGEFWNYLGASPLSRAQETARIIGQHVGLSNIETVPGVIERAYGDAEGQVLSFEDSRHPQDLYHGVEPEAEVYRRGVEAFKQLILQHPGQNLLVVSHGTLIRRVLLATTPGDWTEHVPNATPIEVDIEGLFAWDPESLVLN
ncbi:MULTISPECIES: histidine phosphatase family protein [Micrococcaceae]|uniref:histidine phosphatase family protein n=1 Tax=unclassified Kocuria TaxID=2649579 RepID=UPI0013EB0945|nr:MULTISPECIES: histidine phosphatase family protein [unclassified Kocuria]